MGAKELSQRQRLTEAMSPVLDAGLEKMEAYGLTRAGFAAYFLGVAQGLAFPGKKEVSVGAFVDWALEARGT